MGEIKKNFPERSPAKAHTQQASKQGKAGHRKERQPHRKENRCLASLSQPAVHVCVCVSVCVCLVAPTPPRQWASRRTVPAARPLQSELVRASREREGGPGESAGRPARPVQIDEQQGGLRGGGRIDIKQALKVVRLSQCGRACGRPHSVARGPPPTVA